MEKQPLTDPAVADYFFTAQVGHLLRKVYQRHQAIFQQNIGEAQLTAVQFITLCALRETGPCAQTDLVRITAVDQATIRGVVDRLKARGLIAVIQDTQDKRKVILSLTPEGIAQVGDTIPRARQVTELTYGSLNAAERIALDFLLKKMLEDEESHMP